MDSLLLFLLGLVVGAVIAGGVLWLLMARGRVFGQRAEVLQARQAAELERVRAEEAGARAALRSELAAAEARSSALRDQLAELQRQQQQAAERDRAERQEESRVLQALAPVRETLGAMQRKVAELEQQRSMQHGEIAQQLRTAIESEERLRSTAESLASALKSNSMRGVWGETQLRSVVEAAGLVERVDFSVQSTIGTDAGTGRPDMIVHLPGGKNIAVDAKVPFASYLEANQIPATASGIEAERRAALMRQHVQALRAHVSALGSKAYWSGLEASPDLVIAFIPSESLVSAALEADPAIMEFAFGKRVALASPVTLWSVLKTVAYSWQQDVLTKEAKQLFDLSRELHKRLATTAGHIEKLGRSIEGSVKRYNEFVGSLERQVLPSARRLAELNEAALFPELSTIEEPRRELAAPELLQQLEEEPPRLRRASGA